MAARYQERPRGVFDHESGALVLPGSPEWAVYVAWTAAGNEPDPDDPPAPVPIESRRAEACAVVNAIRSDKLATLTVAALGHTWDADPKSIQNLVGVLVGNAAGLFIPDGFTWRTADNLSVSVTPADLATVGGMMQTAVDAVYRESWRLKDTVIAQSANPEALDLLALWGAQP